ncbi:MAG: pyridoxamine 5'-phosphate oxidase family protein [Candidatus Thorarchaeota archaeon]
MTSSIDSDRDMALELTHSAPAAIVTSVDSEGYPQTRAMFNLRNKEQWPRLVPLFHAHDEDFMLLFTTNTSSSKVRDLKENPKVSIYYTIPSEARGLMLGGDIEIVHDIEIKQGIWHDGWERYYPKGFDDPDHTVLRLYPTMGRGWNQSHTYRFEIGVKK